MNESLIEALSLIFNEPPEDAVNYLKSQGYAVTNNWQEQLAAIKQHCFTVAKTSSADALQIIHDGLLQSLEEGKGFDFFKRSVKGLLETKGFGLKDDGSARRYDVIFRTNLQSAYQSGRFYEMEAAGDEFPYREFVAIDDIRTTSGCRKLNGKVFHYKDKFYLQNQTPRHFNCRSTWVAVPKNEKVDLKTGKDFPDIVPEEGFGVEPGTKPWAPDMKKYKGDIAVNVQDSIVEFNNMTNAVKSLVNEFMLDDDFLTEIKNNGCTVRLKESGEPGSLSTYFYVTKWDKNRNAELVIYKLRISDHKTTNKWLFQSRYGEIFLETKTPDDIKSQIDALEKEYEDIGKQMAALKKGSDEINALASKRNAINSKLVELRKKFFTDYDKNKIKAIKELILEASKLTAEEANP